MRLSVATLLMLLHIGGSCTAQAPLAPELSQAPAPLGDRFVGRQREFAELDEAWRDDDQRLVGVIAWGGFGKSALVRQWIHLREKRWPGSPPEAIYWHSFQTAGDLDEFFFDLVSYFSGELPAPDNLKTPSQKISTLRQAIGKRRYLLVLDGLEPLQNPTRGNEFGLADNPLLGSLLREICEGRLGQGLCVVTSRLPLTDIEQYRGKAYRLIDLEQRPLTMEEGRLILKLEGVSKGTEEEKDGLVELCGRHPLALKMAANLLARYKGGQAARWQEFEEPSAPGWSPPGMGRHLCRVFGWYDQALKPNEKQLMFTVSHFREPVQLKWLEHISKTAADAEEQTHRAQGDLYACLEALVDLGLLREDTFRNTYATHPLVADHYHGPRAAPQSKEMHRRLFQFYKEGTVIRTADLPHTLAGMRPLFEAVYHGCAGGRHQQAFDEVYWPRIMRGEECFLSQRLGAFSADLAALRGFFHVPWRQPVSGLTDAARSRVLKQARHDLQSVRLTGGQQGRQYRFPSSD